MKSRLYWICFIYLLIISCHKDKAPLDPTHEYYGSASAMLNGLNWHPDKVRCGTMDAVCYNKKIEMGLETFSSEGFLREEYTFSKFFPAVSLQKIYPTDFNNYCNDTLNSTYSTIQDDGDVVKDFYVSVPDADNYLNIESYDPVSKIITGSFAATYVIFSRDILDTTAVDTIKVTNGKFSTKILN